MRPTPAADVPQRLGVAIAVARAGLGVVALAAPRVAGRYFYRGGPTDATTVALRMFGARDLAMGLGALLAARRGSSALRGWVEAGAFTDATDVAVMALDRGASLRTPIRQLGMASAAAAATTAAWVARRLPPGDH